MKTVRDNVRTSRFRTPVIIGVAVLAIVLLSANGLARTYTDWLWFDDLGYGQIWTSILGTKILLGLSFSLLFFFLLWGNLVLADRLAPAFRAATPEEDLIERYHQLVGNRGGRIRVAVAAGFALAAGGNTSTQWREWLLFRNGQDFGWEDPLFGRDAGFYMFKLPFITAVVDWVFAVLILTLIVVAVAHYLNGGIRASAPLDRVTSGVKLHLSLLLAALAIVRAVGYWLARFALLTNDRGIVDGAMATDVNIQLPAYNLLALISLFGAALFIANIRRQGWGLPLVAIGLWGVSHLFVGGIFPALYERLAVEPNASTREAETVGFNIAATRFAYGLESALTIEGIDYETGLTSADVDNYQDVFDSVPLVDPRLSADSFARSEAERAIYQFSDPLDVDRYVIDGKMRPVVLSVRGLNVEEVRPGWESEHVVFTHGYGLAMAAGWQVAGNGRPDFLVRGLGDVSIDDGLDETLGQPREYFGEDLPGYAIVNASRPEADYQTSDNASVPYTYEGDGGVPLGSLVRRLAFALRFRELDPLIAAVVTDESQVIYTRDIEERVRTVAPFLRWDNDPYPVVAGDQLHWIIDGYATSADFPYSQAAETTMTGVDLSGGYNYVRNSVKAVIDAYSGEVTLYNVDSTDPVLAAWSAAFPGLFVDGDLMPPSLVDNTRYPEDIFRVQTDMWANYVVSDPVTFIDGATKWSVATQPRPEADATEGDPSVGTLPMAPQYLITQLPDLDGDDSTFNQPEYVLQRAFVPRNSGDPTSDSARPELTGVMVARSDPGHYGELILYEIPSGAVEAPDFAHSEIRKTDELTEFIKDKASSVVQFGQMTMLLIEDTIVYVRPVYVEAASQTAVPELSRVIVMNGEEIAMGATIEEALAGVVDGGDQDAGTSGGDDEPSGTDADDTDDQATGDDDTAAGADPDDDDTAADDGSGSTGTTTVPDYDPTGKSVNRLLADATDFLQAADVAESQGATDEAAALRRQAQVAIGAVQELLGGSATTETAPTTSGT